MLNAKHTIALMGLMTFASTDANAACDFDIANAKGLKASMVRAYQPCPGISMHSANTSTEGGVDACTPVRVPEVDGMGTAYSCGPKGSCTVQISSKIVSSCESLRSSSGDPLNLDPGACHVTSVRAKCKGILSTNGTAPIEAADAGFTLATISRASIAERDNGDMTVIDFPVSFSFDTPSKGEMSLSSSSAEGLISLVGLNHADLPPCTSLEMRSLVIKDPLGLPFAKIGVATTP